MTCHLSVNKWALWHHVIHTNDVTYILRNDDKLFGKYIL